MSVVCKKCGREIDENSPICMYCGTAIPDSEISQEVKNRVIEESAKKPSYEGTSIKAVGAAMIIIGIIIDVFSMILISTGSFGAIGTLTVIGTILFLIGLAIISNS